MLRLGPLWQELKSVGLLFWLPKNEIIIYYAQSASLPIKAFLKEADIFHFSYRRSLT